MMGNNEIDNILKQFVDTCMHDLKAQRSVAFKHLPKDDRLHHNEMIIDYINTALEEMNNTFREELYADYKRT